MTLTCDTGPVTDADDLDKLRLWAEQIARAKKLVADLEEGRNAAIVAALGDDPEYGAITAAARATKLTRQRVDTIRRLARERRAGRDDPKS